MSFGPHHDRTPGNTLRDLVERLTVQGCDSDAGTWPANLDRLSQLIDRHVRGALQECNEPVLAAVRQAVRRLGGTALRPIPSTVNLAISVPPGHRPA